MFFKYKILLIFLYNFLTKHCNVDDINYSEKYNDNNIPKRIISFLTLFLFKLKKNIYNHYVLLSYVYHITCNKKTLYNIIY